MGVNKPLLPKSPFAAGTFQGDQSRAIEKELQKLQLAVRQLREGRIEGVLALDAAPTGGLWAQGDIVQNSAPRRTISASTTFAVVGWQYTDEGSGTLTWAEMRFWESMAAGGGGTFAATSMTATTTGVGTSLYVGNAAGELTLRNLQAGSGISLTVSAGAVRITATGGGGTFAASSQTATSTGTGVAVYVGNAAGELTFRKVQAGTGVSVTTSGGAIRVTATGGGGVSISAGTGISVTTSNGVATVGNKLIAEWGTDVGITPSRDGLVASGLSATHVAERLAALINDLITAGVLTRYLSWNPSDKNANVSLTDSNLTAHVVGTNWYGVRATAKQSTGKRYYEVVFASTNGGNECIPGVARDSAGLGTYLGADANGWGWQCTYSTPRTINNNSFPAYGTTVSAGQVVGVIMDFDTATLEFSINGVSQGVAYTSLSGTLFPAMAVVNNYKMNARFSSTSWSYAPVGAVQW